MSFVAVVPARFGSTRFPGKPLIDIGGKPMVVRVAEQAARSSAQRVVVATDDARIEHACRAHGVDVVLTNSEHPTGTDRLSETGVKLGLAPDTIVVNVQGDEPFIPPQAIDLVAHTLAQHPSAGIATVDHPIHTWEDFLSPNVVKVVKNARAEAQYFSRAPIPYPRDELRLHSAPSGPLPAHIAANAFRHVGLYAYRASFLRAYPSWSQSAAEQLESLEQLRALDRGVVIAVATVAAALPPGIDTPQDYETLRARGFQ